VERTGGHHLSGDLAYANAWVKQTSEVSVLFVGGLGKWGNQKKCLSCYQISVLPVQEISGGWTFYNLKV